MWTCADRSLLYTYLALRQASAHTFTFSTPPFPHPVAGSFSTRYTFTAPKFASAERNDFLSNASMADVDEGGFPVETRAKPKILQVDARPPLPVLCV